ncbi:MAG: DUF2089 domain-containing protein [Coriobacteriia bacterium]|nr:DUF2089 domain-containing protein [Coriobacteriia bacterium]
MDLFGELLDPIINSPIVQAISLGLGVITFALAIALVFWIFRDARRRGSLSIMWGLFGAAALIAGVFIGFTQADWGFIAVGGASLILVLIVLIVYSFLRPADFAADAQERELSQRLLEAELETHACPSCGGGIEVDFLICPSCNVTLRRPCDYCARPIKTTWAVCPYCRANKGQAETRAAAKAPARKPSRKPAEKSDNSADLKSSAPVHDEVAEDDDVDFDTPKRASSPRSSSAGSRSSGASATRSSESGRSSRASSGGGRSSGSGASDRGRTSAAGSPSGSGRSRTSTGTSSSRSSSSTFKD